jgi:hypothetical protein
LLPLEQAQAHSLTCSSADSGGEKPPVASMIRCVVAGSKSRLKDNKGGARSPKRLDGWSARGVRSASRRSAAIHLASIVGSRLAAAAAAPLVSFMSLYFWKAEPSTEYHHTAASVPETE